jgi:hypothetical protein
MTENVIFALIKISSRNEGSGVIIANTMPSTAIGIANSRQFTPRPLDAARLAAAGGFAMARGAALGATRTLGVIF